MQLLCSYQLRHVRAARATGAFRSAPEAMKARGRERERDAWGGGSDVGNELGTIAGGARDAGAEAVTRRARGPRPGAPRRTSSHFSRHERIHRWALMVVTQT